mgnify:CR=1 FL=1|tara:strand:- start:1032 stop:2093 length:1062 start_codon:yes stop_codon:yes gene_type:complete
MGSLKEGDEVNFVLPHKTIKGEVVTGNRDGNQLYYITSGDTIFTELLVDKDLFVERVTGVDPRDTHGKWPFHKDICLTKLQMVIDALWVEITKKYYSDVKVGDTVECLPGLKMVRGSRGNDASETGAGFVPNKQFVIGSINNACNPPCYFPKDGHGVYAHAVKKVEVEDPEEDLILGEFKVGDVLVSLESCKWAKTHAQEPLENEELVAEAIRRYPVGTKFIPAHLTRECSASYMTHDSTIEMDGNGNIHACVEGKTYSTNPEYGSCSGYNRRLYDPVDGWARIIENADVKEAISQITQITDSLDYISGMMTNIRSKTLSKQTPVAIWREPKQVEHTRARQINLIKVKQITLK